MNFIELIEKFPKESTLLISSTATAVGWFSRNIFQLFFENRKYWREQKTFFWKEKINSAKKASEYYLEYLNFLNLAIIQFKLYEDGKIEHQNLIQSIEQEVNYYNLKLKQFPHFEHHHINLFYNFDQSENLKIINENYELLQKINEIVNSESINEDEMKSQFSKIHHNYKILYSRFLNYIDIVRSDLEKYI